MTSLFGILGVGVNGMNAQSFGANVASNNAANVNTEGYSRRSTILEPVGPPPLGGAGARAQGSRRAIDPFLEQRLLGANSNLGESNGRTTALEVIDRVFAETDGNVGSALDKFQAAIADLASNPSNSATRSVFLARANALAQAFQSTSQELTQQRSDTNLRITDEVRQLNGRINEIANLNTQIAQIEVTGQEASDLRDKRDQLVRDVASEVPVKVIERPNGRIILLLAGSLSLVNEDGPAQLLATTTDPATGDVRIVRNTAGANEDVTSLLNSGKIGGFIEARDGALTDAQNKLDQLAFDVTNAYNTAHTAGVGLDGVTGRNLFNSLTTADGAAENFQVSTDVAGNPDAVAAATNSNALPGDNRNALALQALANTRYASGGTATAMESYGALVGSAGAALQDAYAQVDHATATTSQLKSLRESISGVSVDEEMVSLMRFQRAHEATLKVITTADEMLQELMTIKR